MSTRIHIPQRVVEHIAVPIQRLRVARPRHHTIRAHEPSKRWVALRGARGNRSVVCGAEAALVALPCEAEIGGRRAALRTPL
jgi:hypothetical protein